MKDTGSWVSDELNEMDADAKRSVFRVVFKFCVDLIV